MNLLEHYIVQIHRVDEVKEEGTVVVDFTDVCWGSRSRKVRIFSKREWESIQEKGYYMA